MQVHQQEGKVIQYVDAGDILGEFDAAK